MITAAKSALADPHPVIMALISAKGRNWSCKNLSTAEDALLSLLLAALLLT